MLLVFLLSLILFIKTSLIFAEKQIFTLIWSIGNSSSWNILQSIRIDHPLPVCISHQFSYFLYKRKISKVCLKFLEWKKLKIGRRKRIKKRKRELEINSIKYFCERLQEISIIYINWPLVGFKFFICFFSTATDAIFQFTGIRRNYEKSNFFNIFCLLLPYGFYHLTVN